MGEGIWVGKLEPEMRASEEARNILALKRSANQYNPTGYCL